MVDELLVFSQVLLSMQLAFAVIPLIHFVSDRAKMGKFTIGVTTKLIAWAVAVIILSLNIKLFLESVAGWYENSGNIWVKGLIVLLVLFIGFILLITIFYPFILKRKESHKHIHKITPTEFLSGIDTLSFSKIALALDFTDRDQKAIQYAVRMAKEDTILILIHIVESASATVMGNQAEDFETQNDQVTIDNYVSLLREKGYHAVGILGFKDRVGEIARIVKENNCDLLVIGSHGHKTAKDWLFGETINSVRHRIDIPVFIAR